jgi:hypothetical protein
MTRAMALFLHQLLFWNIVRRFRQPGPAAFNQ